MVQAGSGFPQTPSGQPGPAGATGAVAGARKAAARPFSRPAAGPRGRARCPAGARSSRGRRASRRASRTAASSRRCWALEDVSTSGGWAMYAIRSVIAPCTSVIDVHQPRPSRSPRPGRRASGCRPGGRRRSPPAAARARRRRRPARPDRRSAGSLGGQHGHAELDGQALVAGLAPLGQHLPVDGGSAGGCGSDTKVPPPRPRVAKTCPLCVSAMSAWRSVERAMPRRAHSSRSAGSREPGTSSPSLMAVPRRSTVSSKAVCERTGANTASGGASVRERRRGAQRHPPSVPAAQLSQSLEPPDALPVGDRASRRRPARRRRR